MADWWVYALSFLGAYLVGSFPTGVVVSRRRYGLDVRQVGSGNMGATNVTRIFGWRAGFWVFLIDFLKGLLPTWLLSYYFPLDPWLAPLAGFFAVLGHCFSIYLRFRGGKGVASSVGVLLVLNPWTALAAGAVYGLVLAFLRISALGSLAGLAVVLTALVFIQPPQPVVVTMGLISALVLIRHKSNIKRLLSRFWKGSKISS